MASATSISDNDNGESCALCSSKYNRTRTSFCQCKHCSIPLCLDCMKEHHDELLQDVAQISHQYNELQQLLQMKQTMIVDETAKSIEDVNRYFETYINELRDTQQKIIVSMEQEKQKAQDHVQKIHADLRSLGGELQGLAKESIVQTGKMKSVSTELQKIEQQLSTYQATRTENLINTQPDFSIKFDSTPAEIEPLRPTNMEINEIALPVSQEPFFKTNTFTMFSQPSFALKSSTDSIQKNDNAKDESNGSSMSDDDDDDSGSDDSHIETSYHIARMASDGTNILYTSYYDERSDLIAYCLAGDDDEDEHRNWNQSRIKDMLWWGSIGKFICATENGIYTVDYVKRRFKITDVIGGKWSYVRVAANPTHLFTWINSLEKDFNGIKLYSTQFDQIRKIDFNKYRTEAFINRSVSFCVSDNVIASIYTRQQNNREILEVIFCDMTMNKLNSIVLNECNQNIEIRTDGKGLFFITTGRRTLYISGVYGVKQTINLEYNGKWIAVLENRCVAVSNGRSDIQLVTYQKTS